MWFLQGDVGSSQASYWHPERRAAYVVEASAMAEVDTLGIATVLTADANLNFRTGLTATIYRLPPA